MGIFSVLGIIPKVLFIFLLGIIAFIGFKWFSGDFTNIVETKLTVIESPSILKEVKAIGEIIGAEYYGEEIHSLSEAFEQTDKESMQSSFTEIKDSYTLIYNRVEKMRDRNGNLVGYQVHLEKSYADFMQAHTYAENYDKEWFAAFKRLYAENTQTMLEALRVTDWKTFYKKNSTYLNKERRYLRKVRNQGATLIYLARGIVKAGYNLQDLTEDNIIKQNDTLLIQQLSPQILSSDINPWFVLPEASDDKKGIPGYEVLKEYGSPTHEHHAIVKKGCKEDLVKSAIEQGVLTTAEERAEETLLNFLNLLARDSTQVLRVVDIQGDSKK